MRRRTFLLTPFAAALVASVRAQTRRPPQIAARYARHGQAWGFFWNVAGALLAVGVVAAAELPQGTVAFIDQHCANCHDGVEKEAGLDLTAQTFQPEDPQNFARWVQILNRVQAGEMPPKAKRRPESAELAAFTSTLGSTLASVDAIRIAAEGRATRRRLNRHEYENTLRELLETPWLQVKDALPEDGVLHRFNKVGDALDVSHVQMSRYLAVADRALRAVIAPQVARPTASTVRYYAREQRSFTGPMRLPTYVNLTHWTTTPVLGFDAQPAVRRRRAPVTVGAADPITRELEAVGVVSSTFEPLYPRFEKFRAPTDGRYKLRIKAYSIWLGPGNGERWWFPDMDNVFPGRHSEPVTLYADAPPNLLRLLGSFDAKTEPEVSEFDVWLLAGETIRTDAARLTRLVPDVTKDPWKAPLAERDGRPGVAYNWLEVEGPIVEAAWPAAGHRVLFGELPLRATSPVEVVAADPPRDAAKLLRAFVARAYRRPVSDAEAGRFLPLIERKLAAGAPFVEAMLAGYSAVLCSPGFLYLDERPGALDDFAVAARLAFFLTNCAPDAKLRQLAATGRLRHPASLRAQTDRLLNDPRSRRFTNAFLDYWLDLRRITANTPDSALYPDYYLEDFLTESALEETQLFFAELLRHDLPARHLVDSDFAMLNERLAAHYGLWRGAETAMPQREDAERDLLAPERSEKNLSRQQLEALPLPEKRRPLIEGVALRRVTLPPGSVRGGLLTQASVLMVTANGTTTSPVLRGAWIMERILGQPSPPPPAVPAVEPDLRGATTIRAQLALHRNQVSCASCHSKIDPPGFALESFDVMGGWRDRYRALADRGQRERGIGKTGYPFQFRHGLPVDASGEMADGRAFADIRDFKRLLLADQEQIARNLVHQLVVFATGAPIGFSDRAAVEQILQRARLSQFGVRSLIHEIVQSDLFLSK